MTVRYDSEAATGLRTAGHDGVLVATLDRPPANALNRPLLLAMIALFRDRGEGDPPPVVITGAGDRFFCAGGDIKEVDGAAAGPIQQRMRGFHNLLVAMERYRAPVIAAVNGDCVGAASSTRCSRTRCSRRRTPGSDSPRSDMACCPLTKASSASSG